MLTYSVSDCLMTLKLIVSSGLIILALFVVSQTTKVMADSDKRLSATHESYYFVDNADLLEPYASADSKRSALDLLRELDGRARFPSMHDIVTGSKRVIGVRVFAKMQNRTERHRMWSEDLTMVLPKEKLKKNESKTYNLTELVGYYRSYGREGRGSVMYGIAVDGQLTVTVIDQDHLRVAIDARFERIDVEESIYNDSHKDDLSDNDRATGESSEIVFSFTSGFVAERKAHENLMFWEGRPMTDEDQEACAFCGSFLCNGCPLPW